MKSCWIFAFFLTVHYVPQLSCYKIFQMDVSKEDKEQFESLGRAVEELLKKNGRDFSTLERNIRPLRNKINNQLSQIIKSTSKHQKSLCVEGLNVLKRSNNSECLKDIIFDVYTQVSTVEGKMRIMQMESEIKLLELIKEVQKCQNNTSLVRCAEGLVKRWTSDQNELHREYIQEFNKSTKILPRFEVESAKCKAEYEALIDKAKMSCTETREGNSRAQREKRDESGESGEECESKEKRREEKMKRKEEKRRRKEQKRLEKQERKEKRKQEKCKGSSEKPTTEVPKSSTSEASTESPI